MIAKREIKSNEVELFLGKNVTFEGKMTFEGMARLDGRFDGEILSGGVLIVGETAVVKAEVKVGTLVVKGEVNAKVFATARIEIHSTGKLRGNIDTPSLVIEEGGIFDGNCHMDKRLESAMKSVTPMKEVEMKYLQGRASSEEGRRRGDP